MSLPTMEECQEEALASGEPAGRFQPSV
jgi:hypothetical protein